MAGRSITDYLEDDGGWSLFSPAPDNTQEILDTANGLQRRFLRHPLVKRRIDAGGLDQPIAMLGGPTYRDCGEKVLVNWGGWFKRFLSEGGRG